MDKNNKKSRWGLRKEKINIKQCVRTLEEVEPLEETWYPLVFALTKEDLKKLRDGTLSSSLSELLSSYYQEVTFPNIDSSITYLGLDATKIEEKFFSGTCYLNQIKLKTGKTKFVQKVCRNPEHKGEIRLELVLKRKTILNATDTVSITFSDLLSDAIYDYDKQKRKNHIYSEKEIQEIHERGNLTPLEKAREWNNFGICAPGDYASSAKNRYHEFKNCEECLLDYAYNKREYEPIEKHLKVIYPFREDSIGNKVKKIGTR